MKPILTQMARARRTAIGKGRVPRRIVLNTPARVLLAKEGHDGTEWQGIPIDTVNNKSRTPTVVLACNGDLW